jgi:hypothetical protein
MGPRGETVGACLAIHRDRQGDPSQPGLPTLPQTAVVGRARRPFQAHAA